MRAARIVIAIALTAAPAAADPLSPEAQNHRDAGVAAYSAKDFETASREFEAAYKVDHVPDLLYAWAQSDRLRGRCDLALPHYKQYLYSDIPTEYAEKARANIAECERQNPPPPPPRPPPPPHRVVSPPLPPSPPPDDQPWYTNKLGDGLAATGAISLLVGGIYLGKSSDTASHATTAPTLLDHRAALDTATTERRVGVVSIVVGAALVGTAVYVFLDHRRHHRPPASPAPEAIDRSGATWSRPIEVGFRF